MLFMRKFILFSLVLISLASCDDFGKVLKSTDLDYKIERADQYMKEKKYANALTIYENVYGDVRGSNKFEHVAYQIADCNYLLKDYFSASYYFGSFERTFPKSDMAEKSAFLSAYCAYSTSPEFDLDQSDTQKAIETLQLFQLKFPKSPLLDSSQTLIQDLLFKLEKKRFENAKTYYRTTQYKAAVIAFDNMIEDFPNSHFLEDMYYFHFESSYELAINSVLEKKEERLANASKSYINFVDLFPDSERLRGMESKYQRVLEKIEKLNS